jgi:hypothetical protein
MQKIRYTAFRSTPGRTCGHLHKTKALAEACMFKQKVKYGGKWNVSSATYSH